MGESGQEALAAADWTVADYLVARSYWWFTDGEVHSKERIISFMNQTPVTDVWSFSMFKYNLEQQSKALLLAAVFLSFSLVAGWNRRQLFSVVAVLMLICFFCGIRFLPKIAIPVLLLTAFVPVVFSKASFPERNNVKKWGGTVVVLIVSVWTIVSFTGTLVSAKSINGTGRVSLEHGMLQTEKQSNIDFVYLPLASSYFWSPLDYVRPFREDALMVDFPGGWLSQSPARVGAMRKLGLNPDAAIVPQLLNSPEVIYYSLVDASDIQQIPGVFANYLNRHYGNGVGKKRLTPFLVNRLDAGSLSWIFFKIR
jgi:hypothetical protein